MSNLCTPMGTPPPKQLGEGKIFSPLRVGAWSKLFLAISLEKEYRKLVLKFLGLPQINLLGGEGIKVSPKCRDFPTFLPTSPQWSEISPIWKWIIKLWTLPYDMVKKMVYFGPPWNKWLWLIHTHPAICFLVFSQSDSTDGATWAEVFRLL